MWVHDVQSTKLVTVQPAHDAEVMCLAFSPGAGEATPGEEKEDFLLASGSRDRLVHVYNSRRKSADEYAAQQTPYPLVQTLGNHSAAVTALKFSRDGAKLLSCAGDKSIVISSAPSQESGVAPFVRSKCITSAHGTSYGLDVDPTNKFFTTAGQDKKVHIWSLKNGKGVRSYKSDDDSGEIFSVKLDPSGLFVATCSYDKVIRLFDFYSGTCIASAAGHSELITDMLQRRLQAGCNNEC